MLDFFVNNWGTLLAGVIVLAVVILVIVKLIREKGQKILWMRLRTLYCFGRMSP